jgi:hypothetical protein
MTILSLKYWYSVTLTLSGILTLSFRKLAEVFGSELSEIPFFSLYRRVESFIGWVMGGTSNARCSSHSAERG